jgi:glycerol uptake facilitator-like aquaporin
MNNLEPADTPAVSLPFTNRRKSEVPEPKPLPGTHLLPTRPRNELVAFLGEFVGTFLFLFAFAGTHVANMIAAQNPNAGPNASVLLYIALAFVFSLQSMSGSFPHQWRLFQPSGNIFPNFGYFYRLIKEPRR